MPFYEYKCQACGHELEALQKISDEPLKDCPECGKPELSKKLSAPSFGTDGDAISLASDSSSGSRSGGGKD